MAESVPLQFDVPDMRSQKCVLSITEAIRNIAPGAQVIADLNTKRVLIGAEIDAGKAAQAIEAAGFSVKAAG